MKASPQTLGGRRKFVVARVVTTPDLLRLCVVPPTPSLWASSVPLVASGHDASITFMRQVCHKRIPGL